MEMIIMKKEYSKPQIKIVQVSTVLLQDASYNINQNGNYGDGTGITIGSRGSSWDDDWDED